MGMYTELIFGCSLKRETPSHVIDTLKFMIGDLEKPPSNYAFKEGRRHDYLFQSASGYFGVSESVSRMWQDEFSKNWHISTRSNIKNYEGEIESFLEWIKPFVGSGSGNRDMYAITIYEDTEEPTIYYLS